MDVNNNHKPNPFDSNLSIQAIQLLAMIDGGGDKIGDREKQDIIKYVSSYHGGIEMAIDLFFELINEKFLVINSI